METISLSSLTTFIRRVFALNLPEAVWVSAELAQVSASRGHHWLTLVEKSAADASIVAQMDAVLWSGTAKKLHRLHGKKTIAGVLQQGMSVRLRVTADFHERYGLKLTVEDIDPAHTMGALERQRQATLEALAADGLLDRNAALPLPEVMLRLAVISAETAAGLADFRQQLHDNPFGYVFRTELFPAAMQGAQTAEEVTTRLRQIRQRASEYDAVVLVRGGGGKTDLAAFDGETLCRALAEAPLPVLCGIGHEIDATVADRVVHRSLKTPTAVAVFLIEHCARAEARLLRAGRSIEESVNRTLTRQSDRIAGLGERIDRAAASSVQSEHLRSVARQDRLTALAGKNLEIAALNLSGYEGLLRALRPETTLARGYAMLSQEGKVITSRHELLPGDVEVRLRDGKAVLRKD